MRTQLVVAAFAALTTIAVAQKSSPCPATSGTPASAAQLTYTLKQLDTASAKFQRATADFRWDYYQRVLRDTTTQNGSIYFEREGKSTSMGAFILGAGQDSKGKPKFDKVLDYNAGTLRMFSPDVDQITVLRAGPNQAQYEGFLTLGFGGSGVDLSKSWNITDLGADTVENIKTEKLDLTSKTGDKNFTHITVWIDLNRGVSLKQVFYMPSNDCRIATYSNVVVNGNVHKDQFKFKTDKNTTTVTR